MISRVILAAAAGCAFWLSAGAEPGPPPAGGVEVAVLTRQNSRFTGLLRVDRLPIDTPYGTFDLPLDQLRTLDFPEEGGPVRVSLKNGDRLTGAFSRPSWPLECEWGRIDLETVKIRELRFRTRVSAGDKGLLFWNRMGSPDEVARSEKGPGGAMVAGRFTPGVEGDGVEVCPGEGECLVFRDVPIDGRRGCITLWARIMTLDGPPGSVPAFERGGGANPGLFRLLANNGQFALFFSGNDGASGGGLCGSVDWVEWASSGPYGAEWTFDKAVKGRNVSEWHHYALVWDIDGLPGAASGRHQTAIYVDGQPVAGHWINGGSPSGKRIEANPGPAGTLSIHGGSKLVNARVAFDEIRVWDYPKVEFEDEREAVGFPGRR